MENIETKQNNKIIATSIIYIICALLYLFVRIGGKFKLFEFLGDSKEIVLNLAIQVIFIGGGSFLLYMLFEKKSPRQTLKDFKFTKIPARVVSLSFFMGIVLFGMVVILSSVWGFLVDLTGYKIPFFSLSAVSYSSLYEEFIVGTILTCVLPAFCEEILLRGCVLSGYQNLGRKRAIILVALLFGFLHVNINQVFYASILGAILCIITMMTGSIWPAIIMHFTSNFCSVFSTFIYKLNLFDGKFNLFLNSIFNGNFIISIFNYVLFSIILVSMFISLFLQIAKYAKSKQMYDKLKVIMEKGNLQMGEQVEINEQTGTALIEMKNLVQNEIYSQVYSARNIFDFFIPKTESETYKPTRLEWTFIIISLVLTGGATLISFLGGVFL